MRLAFAIPCDLLPFYWNADERRYEAFGRGICLKGRFQILCNCIATAPLPISDPDGRSHGFRSPILGIGEIGLRGFFFGAKGPLLVLRGSIYARGHFWTLEAAG